MPEFFRQLSALALLAITGVLAYALFDQFVFWDLPCPLCLLQRVGFGLVGLGFALNVLFGCRPSHYGIAIAGSVGGAMVAVRQVLLHIVPGTGSYGDPLFGLHFYTWALIAFITAVLGTSFLLMFDRQFTKGTPVSPVGWSGASVLGKLAVGLFGLVVLVNVLSTTAECGLGPCADNPTAYE